MGLLKDNAIHVVLLLLGRGPLHGIIMHMIVSYLVVLA